MYEEQQFEGYVQAYEERDRKWQKASPEEDNGRRGGLAMGFMQRDGTAARIRQADCECTECTARGGKKPAAAPSEEHSMQVDGGEVSGKPEGSPREGGGVQVVEVEAAGN